MAKKELSYGIIPLRKIGGDWQVLMVRHQAGHWSFPKGHPEKNETPKQTAARELQEETSCSVEQFLHLDSLKETYFFFKEQIRIEKTVEYYIAKVKGEAKGQVEEIDELRWLSFQEAEKIATFPATKAVCAQLIQMKPLLE